LDDVSKLKDPFILVAGVVGPEISEGMEINGRGINGSSIYLILSFNFAFSASRMLMESSNASLVALWILDTWEGHIFFMLTFDRNFPFLFFASLFSIIIFLDSLSNKAL
jgi:hypothetical protein